MVPPKTDPRWRSLIEGRIDVEPSFLALKLLLQRIRLRYDLNKKTVNMSELVNDLHAFFVKYESFLAEDMKKIFH